MDAERRSVLGNDLYYRRLDAFAARGADRATSIIESEVISAAAGHAELPICAPGMARQRTGFGSDTRRARAAFLASAGVGERRIFALSLPFRQILSARSLRLTQKRQRPRREWHPPRPLCFPTRVNFRTAWMVRARVLIKQDLGPRLLDGNEAFPLQAFEHRKCRR